MRSIVMTNENKFLFFRRGEIPRCYARYREKHDSSLTIPQKLGMVRIPCLQTSRFVSRWNWLLEYISRLLVEPPVRTVYYTYEFYCFALYLRLGQSFGHRITVSNTRYCTALYQKDKYRTVPQGEKNEYRLRHCIVYCHW